jgi:hypothetical protein
MVMRRRAQSTPSDVTPRKKLKPVPEGLAETLVEDAELNRTAHPAA